MVTFDSQCTTGSFVLQDTTDSKAASPGDQWPLGIILYTGNLSPVVQNPRKTPLGIVPKTIRLYQLRRAFQQALSKQGKTRGEYFERPYYCNWAAIRLLVKIMHSDSENAGRAGRGWIEGICRCKSPLCPICGPRIMGLRRYRLEQCLRETVYRPVLFTVTVRHKLKDDPKVLLAAIGDTSRRFFAGKQWQGLKNKYGVVGVVRRLEGTYSLKNGNHPHYHYLLPVEPDSDLAAMQADFCQRWLDLLKKTGQWASDQHGADFNAGPGDRSSAIDELLNDYMFKAERDIPIFGGHHKWNLADELTSQAKKGREKGLSWFQMLAAFYDGDESFLPIILQYYNAYKGQRWITSSGICRSWLSESDADLLSQWEKRPKDEFASFTVPEWRVLRSISSVELIGYAVRAAADLDQEVIDQIRRFLVTGDYHDIDRIIADL